MTLYTYGLEYAAIPLVACPILYIWEYYGLAGSLLAGSFLTLIFGGLALLRGEFLRRTAMEGKAVVDRLDPVYPTFVGLTLLSFCALQVILSVSHWSYYRDGNPVCDPRDLTKPLDTHTHTHTHTHSSASLEKVCRLK